MNFRTIYQSHNPVPSGNLEKMLGKALHQRVFLRDQEPTKLDQWHSILKSQGSMLVRDKKILNPQHWYQEPAHITQKLNTLKKDYHPIQWRWNLEVALLALPHTYLGRETIVRKWTIRGNRHNMALDHLPERLEWKENWMFLDLEPTDLIQQLVMLLLMLCQTELTSKNTFDWRFESISFFMRNIL